MLKFTLVVEIQWLLSCRRPPLLDRSLRRWLPVQSYEGPTKILTTQPDAYIPKPCWQGCKCCYNFASSPLVAIARSTERGCHVACALIGTNCATWLALRRVAAGVAMATRSAVASRKLIFLLCHDLLTMPFFDAEIYPIESSKTTEVSNMQIEDSSYRTEMDMTKETVLGFTHS